MLEVRPMNPGSNIILCVETYPASDGQDRCMRTGVHSALHFDKYGRSWSTATVTTVSQEQPQPHGTGAAVEKESLSMDTNKDTAQCKSLSMPKNERCRNTEAAMTNTVTYTERQLQVLKMFAEGYTYKDIAEALCVSPATVQAVRTAIIEKLAATNITHAVVNAIKLGLIDV